MKILAFNEWYFVLTGILKLNQQSSLLIFIKNVYFIFLLGPGMCWMAGAYIYYHLNNFTKIIVAAMVLVNGDMACGKYVFLRLNQERIKNLMQDLQEIVDKGALCAFYSDLHTETVG